MFASIQDFAAKVVKIACLYKVEVFPTMSYKSNKNFIHSIKQDTILLRPGPEPSEVFPAATFHIDSVIMIEENYCHNTCREVHFFEEFAFFVIEGVRKWRNKIII